jgi:hypothetical protein
MVERIKRIAEHFMHGHPRTAAVAVDARPLPPTAQDDAVVAMGSDHLLLLDEAHWDEAQALLARDDLYDSQTAKFSLGRPRNFS